MIYLLSVCSKMGGVEAAAASGWLEELPFSVRLTDWCGELFDFSKRESQGCMHQIRDYYVEFPAAQCKNACVPRFLGWTAASASVARDFQQLFISRDVLLVVGYWPSRVEMGNADQSLLHCIPISPCFLLATKEAEGDERCRGTRKDSSWSIDLY